MYKRGLLFGLSRINEYTAQSLLVSQKGRPLNHAKVGGSLARSTVKRPGAIDKPGTEKSFSISR